MKQRKGFVRILEAIIASLILLTSLSYFFIIERYSFWGDVLTQTQVNDAMASLYINGTVQQAILLNNATLLHTRLKRMLPETVDFSVEVRGIPNPVIRIGCNCTTEETQKLKDMLYSTAFGYKKRNIMLVVTNDSLDNLAYAPIDVVVFFGYRQFDAANRSYLSNFLANGKTLFMLADLKENEVKDGFIGPLFGLSWRPQGCGGNNGNGRFPESQENPSSYAFKVRNYFANISGLDANTVFKKFNTQSNGDGANCITVDETTAIESSNGRFSYLKLNITVSGKGRTAWMAHYTPDEDEENAAEVLSNLTTASIMWASGEQFLLDPPFKTVPKVQRSVSYHHIGVLDGYETFATRVMVWRIFY
ncbi:MAG: hypothetical protein HYY37_02265 [Candidatus Aenigmarchaeota archaeon]|nr:hypothetical protein [Candidatus Aenigmarchaeota archaeon]